MRMLLFNIHFIHSNRLGDKMLDIPSISAVVAAAGVMVGVVFTAMELRNLVKTKQTDLIVRLHSDSFSNKEFLESVHKLTTSEIKDYNDYMKKYEVEAWHVCNFYETIGILLHRKLVDIGLVADLMSVKGLWEKLKPMIEADREQSGKPKIYEWFEYLYNEMQKREQTLQAQQ